MAPRGGLQLLRLSRFQSGCNWVSGEEIWQTLAAMIDEQEDSITEAEPHGKKTTTSRVHSYVELLLCFGSVQCAEDGELKPRL